MTLSYHAIACIHMAFFDVIAYLIIYHFDTLDQRESVLDKSHIAHPSVRYKKYRTLILAKIFQDIITFLL